MHFYLRECVDSMCVQVMLLGPSGVGKSEIINSLVGSRVAGRNPFEAPSSRGTMVKRSLDGVPFEFLEMPGLTHLEDCARIIAK
jgi:putative ribosome biogenesis GTPase RsgA